MSRFEGFNAENKLRIPLSAYAAQIIENDCVSFSKKKTTLINAIILNYYHIAECSISLRLIDYKEELSHCFSAVERKNNDSIINKIVLGKGKELKNKYAKRYLADVNWQITLNKKVKELLTMDPHSQEEEYYGDRPGHYVRALIEEYARLPFYQREEVVFKPILDVVKDAINKEYVISLTNIKGNTVTLKPYRIDSDPMSMYHYVIGYSVVPVSALSQTEAKYNPQVISIRLSRLTDIETMYYNSGKLSDKEISQIEQELSEKGVQFVSGTTAPIKIWLSDFGIKKFNTQLHLRPIGMPDKSDEHIYNF